MTAQAERMAATLVRIAREQQDLIRSAGQVGGVVSAAAVPATVGWDRARRWEDLPGHEDMLLEAELAHAQDGDDRPALRARAIAIAEARLFGDDSC